MILHDRPGYHTIPLIIVNDRLVVLVVVLHGGSVAGQRVPSVTMSENHVGRSVVG